MVSVSTLLQVITRHFEAPQPSFLQMHANAIMRFVCSVPLSLRSRTDKLNMMQIVLHCPHATTLFAKDAQLSARILLSFFVDRMVDDGELEEVQRQIIRSVSVNQDLPTPLLLTMARKLSRQRRDSSQMDSSPALEQEDALVEELLERVVRRMPRFGQGIREGTTDAVLSQKEMHKRESTGFEKPELLFLISTLRHTTASRSARWRDNGMETISTPMPLSAHIVEPVVQCVQSFPTFRKEDASPRSDDWVLMAHLIGCCDTRLHDLGVQLWRQKASRYEPIGRTLHNGLSFSFALAGFLCALKGAAKRDALELWIDIVTTPEDLSEMSQKMLRLLLVDVTLTLRGGCETHFHEQLILGGNRILAALDAAYASSSPSAVVASRNSAWTRMSFVRFFPPLETPKELENTLLRLREAFAVNDAMDSEFIRESADFVRFLQRKDFVDKHMLAAVSQLLAERLLHMLERPLSDEECAVALIPAIVTFTAQLRDIQAKESKEEEDVTLRNLFHAIAMKLLHHDSLKATPFLIAVLLQMMELFDFTSTTQHTTKVRELTLTALRSVPSKLQEINSHTAQHCLDLTLRAVRFHVADSEVLTAALVALRHTTDGAIMQEMNWEQRSLTIERGAVVYRELSHSFATLKQARRLGKQIVTMTALVASEKVAPRGPPMQSNGTCGYKDWKYLRRSAQVMWLVAVRAALLPIPRTPVDRYLVSMLRFVKKYWIAEKLTMNGQKDKMTKDMVVQEVDERLSRDFLDGLLPLLHPLMASAFTNKRVFFANLRRNKLIISTACGVLQRNKDFLSPCVWFHAQRTLSNLPSALTGQATSLELGTLQLALKHTLRNVRACNNRGTWHLTEHRKTLRQETEDETILTPKWIGDMFSCAELIDDPDSRAYLISLITDFLEATGGEAEENGDGAPISEEEEKTQSVFLQKIIQALRRGSVLYD
ncbi:hypothetical protein TraAM80_04282 [Trypanosoma rangeli]|uniref:Uncharacterized protein n=1 Tax=Trypanosoma rangeli TaxID=5698 RepID=A0A3R7KGC2_TRYRA|nr:uncharacterized protein TraAM80_04282 [Trypanosoma rangeli]RNF05946.1 hypothetical protein TraAM80_04282 [Trypanosoma rangeli]|eukprot:RNF05946.1 hypothetical protein TraAM80_04282 [Trypanosoma rangeli]